MKRLAWVTDIHLNFLQPPRLEAFYSTLANAPADALLLSGDIGEAPDVTLFLEALAIRFGRPIYFVLGNHDFYHGSIAGVRARVEALCGASPGLVWLPRAGVVPLTAETGLLGHDGWGDGRLGDYWASQVQLNDFYLIEELSSIDCRERLARLEALGDEAAAHFQAALPHALEQFPSLMVVTHVPPFREACWYAGRISDDHWLPFFACKAVGDALAQAMRARPDRRMTVLCGHTHETGQTQILPNLLVLTGGAQYGAPHIQRILTVE
jgi:predicted phosphodiesterase